MQTARLALAVDRLMLSLWAGAAGFFMLIAAPAAFAALENRSLAGDVVGQMLQRYHPAGFGFAGLALAGSLLSRRAWVSSAAFAVHLSSIVLVLACLFVDWAWLFHKVQALRFDIPPSGLDEGSELYKTFFFWHGMSMLANTIMLVLTLAAALTAVWPKPSSE